MNKTPDTHLLTAGKTLSEALKAMNDMESGEQLTLFVTDADGVAIGSLTDGDIRRSLVAGGSLELPVEHVANRNFSFLDAGGCDVMTIREARRKGIGLLPVLDSRKHVLELVDLKKQKSYLPVDAVLMAGGKGERLRPLTENTPKPLLKVGDKAIIDYNVESLASYGVRNIHVSVNYLKEQMEEHFATPRKDVDVELVSEPRYLGTIGALKLVRQYHNDTVLLMNSDIFTNINFEDFYLHFKEQGADMSVAAVPYTISVPYGVFELDGCNVKGVLEKPSYSYYTNAGIYLIRKELLGLIPDDTFYNATDFMELLISKGMKLTRFPLNGTWIDIGSPQDYQKANELVNRI